MRYCRRRLCKRYRHLPKSFVCCAFLKDGVIYEAALHHVQVDVATPALDGDIQHWIAGLQDPAIHYLRYGLARHIGECVPQVGAFGVAY